jgi:DNA-directed RNA polymerase specialized sigma24 family protein
VGFNDPYPAHTPDQQRRRRQRECRFDSVLFVPDAALDADPLARLVAEESEREVQQHLDTEMDRHGLTVKERMVYVLVVGCGHTVRRTAWIMRSTRTTVHRWLQDAREKMGVTG